VERPYPIGMKIIHCFLRGGSLITSHFQNAKSHMARKKRKTWRKTSALPPENQETIAKGIDNDPTNFLFLLKEIVWPLGLLTFLQFGTVFSQKRDRPKLRIEW